MTNRLLSTVLSAAAAYFVYGVPLGSQVRIHTADPPPFIEEVDVVALSHLDVGFTDIPSTAMELQRRYLDIAVDLCHATASKPAEERYYWTVESQLPLADWWNASNALRRQRFIQCVKRGQIDVGAFAFNQQPFLNEDEWHLMTHWIPDSLWHRVHPTTGIQDDVNGIPRQGALELLHRGVHRLWMGVNPDGGGPPFPAPSAFWWKMPDGRRMFTYLANGYYEGQLDFDSTIWRRGPSPRAYDLQFRPPGREDILSTRSAALLDAQAHLSKVLHDAEAHGYKAPIYIVSFSNQWRFDNDPPFPDLPRFVAAWNHQGLKPRLRFTTVSEAMSRLEERYGAQAREFTGEWTDWWAEGMPSDPRVVAASREAKRTLQDSQSDLWGNPSPYLLQRRSDLWRKLALFEEHTWGSFWSVAFPHGHDTEAQYDEKALLAYQPNEQSKWLLSQQARWRLNDQRGGMAVVNTSDLPWSGWIDLDSEALRGNYKSVRDTSTGIVTPLSSEPGVKVEWANDPREVTERNYTRVHPDASPKTRTRFWMSYVGAHQLRYLEFGEQEVKPSLQAKSTFTLQSDEFGWPTAIRWPNMNSPLFSGDMGGFSVLTVEGVNPRERAIELEDARSGPELERLRSGVLVETAALEKTQAEREDNDYTVIYRQMLFHPRLKWYERSLEIWKDEPRARLTASFFRLPSADAEAFFISTDLPSAVGAPIVSNGGLPFRPYEEQLTGSNMDYFAIDGWARYATGSGDFLWMSRDAPVVDFGGVHLFQHLTHAPANLNKIHSMVFNNTWYVNWVADSSGEMSFQYDLIFQPTPIQHPDVLARNIWFKPTVMLLPNGPEDPIVLKDLFKP